MFKNGGSNMAMKMTSYEEDALSLLNVNMHPVSKESIVSISASVISYSFISWFFTDSKLIPNFFLNDFFLQTKKKSGKPRGSRG